MIPDARAELTIEGRVMPASNATFVGRVDGGRVVYKPIAGERPLWDFPGGTLAGREVAAYAVSEALGWDIVPPTILRDGPHGPGMVQAWREIDPDQAPVDIVPEGALAEGWRHVFDGLDARDRPVSLVHEDSAALRRMALFDVVTNNADRKGGHVLAMPGGHRHGVDHGLTFHVDHKLRTVLWGWTGERLTEEERDGVGRLSHALSNDLPVVLGDLIAQPEIDALARRTAQVLESGRFPLPVSGDYPVIPWPPM